MTEFGSYYDVASEHERIAANDDSSFNHFMHQLVNSDTLKLALQNHALDSVYGLDDPAHLVKYASLVFDSDEGIRANVTRWYRDTPVSLEQRQRGQNVYVG